MRVFRVVATLAMVLTFLLTGVTPNVSVAQDDQTAGATHLFLPMTVNKSVPMQTAPTAQADGAFVTLDVSAAEQAATEKFSDRERMMAAVPLDTVQVSAGEAESAQTRRRLCRQAHAEWHQAACPTPRPRPWPGNSMPPNGHALKPIKRYRKPTWEQPVSLRIDAFSSDPPFASYYINDSTSTWKQYPWITMGRLFFKIPGLGGTYACTASVAYGNALWTAGHCVYTQGRGWHTNFFFVPAYRNGNYPYGSFTAKSLSALAGWVYDHNLAYDIALVAVNDRSGLKVSQWVGSLGFLYNASGTQLFHAFGYPGNYSSGAYLVTCAASTFRRDTLPGPPPIGIGCNMDDGSSGGPWLVAYAPFKGGSTNYVNSVVSYRYNGEPHKLYGPYFGTEAKWLYDWGKTQ